MMARILILFLFTFNAGAGTLFHYKDKSGTLHIVDSEAQIPEEYRDQTKKQVTETPAAAPAQEDEEEAPAKPALRKKGRNRGN